MTQTQPEYGTNHAIYVLVLIIIILAGATSYLYYQKLQLESGSSSSYIVDYKNSAVLDKDKPVSLAVSGRVTLDYQTPRPGYIVIEFTSTQPTVITVRSLRQRIMLGILWTASRVSATLASRSQCFQVTHPSPSSTIICC